MDCNNLPETQYGQSLLNMDEAVAYLNAALEDSQEAFLKALKNVAQARQMADVAKEAGIRRETLYRAFSAEGNPTIATLSSVLNALGMKIQIASMMEQGKRSVAGSRR